VRWVRVYASGARGEEVFRVDFAHARACSTHGAGRAGLGQLLRACLGQLNRNHGVVFMHAYIYSWLLPIDSMPLKATVNGNPSEWCFSSRKKNKIFFPFLLPSS
jgi:hypothetical protein